MTCPESLRTQSYLDGELQGAKALEAERHLETCAECQRLAAETADLSDALRQASRHRASSVLRARVMAGLDREPRRLKAGFWYGAASGGAVSLLAAALALFVLLPPSAASLAQSVAEAHASALTQNRLIAVASSNHHTVKPWLAAHAGLSPPAQDFGPQGFRLAGGRVDEVAGHLAAVTVYRHGNHELDLFAWPDRGGPLPAPAMIRGFRIRFWKRGDLDFAAVSDVDADAFAKFTALAQAERE